MNQDNTAHELSPFFDAVGRVTAAGARMDASLHQLLGSLSMEATLMMHANTASTVQLIDFCRLALDVHTKDPEDEAAISACLDRANVLRIRRNDVVHSLYMQADAGDVWDAMKPVKKNVGYKVTSITVEALLTLSKDIETLLSDMFRASWNATAAKLPGMEASRFVVDGDENPATQGT